MRKLVLTSFAMLLTAGLFAQTSSVWLEMNNFHGYMSSAFHPAEEGNFSPLKDKAEEMLTSAKLWQRSAIPKEYKPAETKTALIELVKQTTAVRDAVVRKAPDEELKNLVTGAHDIFHKIVGECKVTEK